MCSAINKPESMNDQEDIMKYVNLGRTDIRVSRLAVGGMSFGKASEDFHLWTLDQEKTKEMIGHALDLGVNFIDTANQYSHGTSEEYIGKALKDLGIARDKVVIATKVYFKKNNREFSLTCMGDESVFYIICSEKIMLYHNVLL